MKIKCIDNEERIFYEIKGAKCSNCGIMIECNDYSMLKYHSCNFICNKQSECKNKQCQSDINFKINKCFCRSCEIKGCIFEGNKDNQDNCMILKQGKFK
jgi:hypothetical protein